MAYAVVMGLSACANTNSPMANEISKRYPKSLYMYAGANCTWEHPTPVNWPNAQLDEGIHRSSISNLDGGPASGAVELYIDDLVAASDAIWAAGGPTLPAKVAFKGWLVQCADDPNTVMLANSITLKRDRKSGPAL